MATETTASSLPPEMLKLIFSKLDPEYLPPLALVSKSFLSTVRSVVYRLTFLKYIPDTPDLYTNFDRFPSVTEITLCCQPTKHVLLAISNSKLNMKTLRLLNCPKNLQYDRILTLPPSSSSRITSTLRCLQIHWGAELSSFKSEQLIRFIHQFPSLTELQLSNSPGLDDRLIQMIVSKLQNLRKLKLPRHVFLTDDTLAAISSNCVYLEHLDVEYCFQITPGGLAALIRSCEHLHTLYLPELVRVTDDVTEASIEQECANPKLVELMETISSCENLKHLSFGWAFLARDVILRTLAKSRPPLSILKIYKAVSRDDTNFTMAGVSELIHSCRGRLVYLDVELPRSDELGTQDREMSLIVARLPHLKIVKILGSASSMDETRESMKRNCPLLKYAQVYWNCRWR